MRVPYFKILDESEKSVYDSLMSGIKFEKIKCWDIEAPDDFENHIPCEDSKKW